MLSRDKWLKEEREILMKMKRRERNGRRERAREVVNIYGAGRCEMSGMLFTE